MNGWDEAMKSGGPIVISIVAAVALVTGRGVAAPAHTTNIADVAPDPLLEGMAAAGLKDPAYRTAYRECMAARTGRQP